MESEDYKGRECIHRQDGVAGEFYSGEDYIRSLERVRAASAFEIAKRVGSFFFADAERVKVWLCQKCAERLTLR